jgi:hypothetical protein
MHAVRRGRLGVGLALALVGAAGCLAVTGGDEPVPMCQSSDDCDHAAGEVCDEGVCWGDPPADAVFSAVLVPPEGRDDLVATEVPELAITQTGEVDGLIFADSIEVWGRVVLATRIEESIAAHIQIRRPSRIPGGPAYARTVIAQSSNLPGEIAFWVRLPALAPDDEPYLCTIVPDDGTLGGITPLGIPAELAPPARFTIDGQGDLEVEWRLGDPLHSKLATGRVVSAVGQGVSGMRVFAMADSPSGPLDRASSVATTDDSGAFAIWLPTEEDEVFDIIARPAAGTFAPTLRKRGVLIPDPGPGPGEFLPVDLGDLVMPTYPTAVRYVLPVQGHDTAGGVSPVAGVEVRLTTILVDEASVEVEGGVTAKYTATGWTDEAGLVALDLIPGGTGNRDYVATAQPLPSSWNGALWQEPVWVGPPSPDGTGQSVLPPLMLSGRVAASGTLTTVDGTPVAGASISAAASPAFQWPLELDLQAELEQFRYPTATTDDYGRFLIWLDPMLVGEAVRYDLDLVPAAGTNAPRWSIDNIDLGDVELGNERALDLGDVILPAAAYARGPALTADGEAIADAEIKIYQVNPDSMICEGAQRPYADECHAPAWLRGVTRSGMDGQVVVILPDE